jgi:uncharacterized membrane protein
MKRWGRVLLLIWFATGAVISLLAQNSQVSGQILARCQFCHYMGPDESVSGGPRGVKLEDYIRKPCPHVAGDSGP